MSLTIDKCANCGSPKSDLLARNRPSRFCETCRIARTDGRAVIKRRLMEALQN